MEHKNRFGLINKFLVFSLSMLCLGMGASTLFSYHQSKQALHDSIASQATQLVESTNKLMDAWVNDRKLDFANWSEQNIFRSAVQDTFLGKAARTSADAQLAKLKKQYGYYEALLLADTAGTVLSASDPSLIGAAPLSARHYQSALAGTASVSQVMPSGQTGEPVFLIAAPLRQDDRVAGVLLGILQLGHLGREFVASIRLGTSGYGFVFDSQGMVLAHPDKSKIFKLDLNDLPFGAQLLEKRHGVLEYAHNGEEQLTAVSTHENLGWTLAATGPTAELYGPAKRIGQISLLVTVLVILVISATALVFVRKLAKPISDAVSLAETIQAGELSERLEIQSSDEVGQLGMALNAMADDLEQKAHLASEIAAGNLAAEVAMSSDKDLLGKALTGMVENLNEAFDQVRVAVDQIANGALEVSHTSQSLSQGVSAQVRSIESITAFLTDTRNRTEQNIEYAKEASQLSVAAQQAAHNGNAQMEEMVAAMTEINQSGQNIFKIIKVIDEIAFQTNLLALNAAVEAARAGKYGKGFAVVAEEVRNLAARSAKAAQETAELIEGAVGKAKNGMQIADRTADALKEIVTGVSQVSDLVAQIVDASIEQGQGIREIDQGVAEVETVTHQNSSTAEESASASEELSSQSSQLMQMLTRFNLKPQQGATPVQIEPEKKSLPEHT